MTEQTDQQQNARQTQQGGQQQQQGEGSYEGTRDYNARTEDFLERKGAEVPLLARDAANAVEGSEAEELRQAEEEGKSHAAD